jgi:hypothetical protein
MTPLRRAQRTAQPRGPVLPPQPPGPAPRDRCSTRSPERPPPPRISVRTALSRPPGGRQRQSRRQQDVLRMIHDRPVVTVKDITIACVDHREAPARDNGQERGTGLLLPDEGAHPRNSLAWAPTIGLDGGSRREALGPSCAHSLLGPSARHPSRAAPRSARTPSSSPLDTCFDPDAAEGLSARYELDLGESTFPLPSRIGRSRPVAVPMPRRDHRERRRHRRRGDLERPQAHQVPRAGGLRIERRRRAVTRLLTLFPQPQAPAAQPVAIATPRSLRRRAARRRASRAWRRGIRRAVPAVTRRARSPRC